jgi:hypothetical protein
MPKKTLPRIAAVTADTKPFTLRVRWEKGEESRIDLSGMIEAFRVYEPLRQSRDLFRRVRVVAVSASMASHEIRYPPAFAGS